MTETRKPTKTATPRMDALARLPVFFALAGKRVVVAGGRPAAAWKVELLSATGAAVDVIAADISDEMRDIAQDAPNGPVTLHARAWAAADLSGAAIAIGDFADEDEAARFATAARAAGVPVNVIDKPKFCDFAFGAIVNRSPLVIGISTDGGAPVFGQAIRAKLEALLPQGFAQWADAARRWRDQVKASGLSFEARRRLWQLFTAQAIRNPSNVPSEADFASLLTETHTQAKAAEAGSVTLVGAGPGDPELLTLKAVRALQSADVILFDDLVARDILDFARREAKKMLVGKTGYGPACKQDDINALMVSLAKAGRRVVRLKGGDPLIFGRAGEEIEACRLAGIAVEIVPGITSAQGAAARLGVSLTERATARRVQYITGHDRNGKLPDDIDWASIADPTATTVVYMPKKTLGQLATRAIAQGLDPKTPAVAIAGATRANEVVVAAPISEIAEKIALAKLESPVLVLIGRALAGAVAKRDGATAQSHKRDTGTS
jgi:uroporphyrin-III C-methyltransferase/precorrin-2 dehydrogenase/sirohydrochlorin ferrochelatase